MAVSTFGDLKSHIADTLNRGDLTSVIPTFVQQFESQAKRDFRLRRLTNRGTFVVSTEEVPLPSDFAQLESWTHDGPTYYGPIEIVSSAQLANAKSAYGDTGVPQFATLVARRALLAPEPDGTYNTKMTYWQSLTSLSADGDSNWLLEDSPDIYLYGSLIEAAPYLKDDERTGLWASIYETRVEAFYQNMIDRSWGGTIGARTFTPFG